MSRLVFEVPVVDAWLGGYGVDPAAIGVYRHYPEDEFTDLAVQLHTPHGDLILSDAEARDLIAALEHILAKPEWRTK